MNLEDKIPEIAAWIENVVGEAQPSSKSVESFGFARLGRSYSSATLRQTRVVEVDGPVPRPPLAQMGLEGFGEFESANFDGITFGSTYFIKRVSIGDEGLHFHELVHVIQWKALTPARFLMRYATEFITLGYAAMPLERMAYEFQRHFELGEDIDGIESKISGLLNSP